MGRKQYRMKCPSCEKQFTFTEADVFLNGLVLKSLNAPPPQEVVTCPHCQKVIEVQIPADPN